MRPESEGHMPSKLGGGGGGGVGRKDQSHYGSFPFVPPPPPQLSGRILFATPDARAIFSL